MNVRVIGRALVVLVALVAVACGERSLLKPEEIFGTFQLRSMGGERLPITGVLSNGFTPTTVAGRLILNPDFTFQRITETTRAWHDGSVTGPHLFESVGTWDVSGPEKLTLQETLPLGIRYAGRATKNRVEVWWLSETHKAVYVR